MHHRSGKKKGTRRCPVSFGAVSCLVETPAWSPLPAPATPRGVRSRSDVAGGKEPPAGIWGRRPLDYRPSLANDLLSAELPVCALEGPPTPCTVVRDDLLEHRLERGRVERFSFADGTLSGRRCLESC